MVLFTAVECTWFHKWASVQDQLYSSKLASQLRYLVRYFNSWRGGRGITIDLCFCNSNFVALRSDLCDKTFSYCIPGSPGCFLSWHVCLMLSIISCIWKSVKCRGRSAHITLLFGGVGWGVVILELIPVSNFHLQ